MPQGLIEQDHSAHVVRSLEISVYRPGRSFAAGRISTADATARQQPDLMRPLFLFDSTCSPDPPVATRRERRPNQTADPMPRGRTTDGRSITGLVPAGKSGIEGPISSAIGGSRALLNSGLGQVVKRIAVEIGDPRPGTVLSTNRASS